MAKTKIKYVCQACGGEQLRWFGKCPDCDEWNTLVEETVAAQTPGAKAAAAKILTPKARPVPMAQIEMTEEDRLPTGLSELDRVLGGGIVPGSLVLLGGDPGIGKCVAGDTRVVDPNTGDFAPITDWKDGARGVCAMDEGSLRIGPKVATLFHSHGVQPIVEVVTGLGRRLRCTPSHPVFTPDGWQPVGSLEPGTAIATPRALPYFGNEMLPNAAVRLVAYVLSDGSAGGAISITSMLPEVASDIRALADELGMGLTVYPKPGSRASQYRLVQKNEARLAARQEVAAALHRAHSGSGLHWQELARRANVSPALLNAWRRATSVPDEASLSRLALALEVPLADLAPGARDRASKETAAAKWLRHFGLWDCRAATKAVPSAIFRLPKDQLASFLKVLFSCDGSVYINAAGTPGLSYCSISRKLAEDVQHLMLRFGFISRLRTKTQIVNEQPYESFELQLLGIEQVRRFLAEVGIWGRHSARDAIALLPSPELPSTRMDTIPTGPRFWTRLEVATRGASFREISTATGVTLRNRRHTAPLCRRTVEAIAGAYPDSYFQSLATGDVYWDHIASITPAGTEAVYDITVPGPANFIANDLIIHNSTITLQVAQLLAAAGRKVLYCSGEESARQIRLRARRLGAEHPNLYVQAETDVRAIEAALLDLRPDWAVIDSIQAVYDSDSTSLPGSVSQVRAATGTMMRVAKEHGIALCLVGHVTKEGTLAGPRVLEHMVDTVLYFEGDRFKSHRLIRGVKNRFGSTNEVGIFEMEAGGLKEVTNPSELFLSERAADASGSAIVPTMEGTRPLLVEVQALVSPSSLAQPRRSATGVEHNRLVQILAVLEKRVGLGLSKADVYLNVVGGLAIGEPAADLGVALAVASSLRDVTIPADLVAIGEIGLNGEIRAVSSLEARLREAAKLGFRTAIVPEHNLGQCILPPGLEVIGTTRLMDAIVKALGGMSQG